MRPLCSSRASSRCAAPEPVPAIANQLGCIETAVRLTEKHPEHALLRFGKQSIREAFPSGARVPRAVGPEIAPCPVAIPAVPGEHLANPRARI